MENKINKTNKGPAPFEFPKEAADALASANITTVGLPFETYVWFVKNGRPAAKQMGGISYTGGFACSSIPEANYKLMDVFGETHDLSAIFEPLTNTNVNSQGVEYNTVDLPSLIVTPVLYRKRFFENRSHTQILCLQLLPGEEQIVIWSMLSAKGYQSSTMLDEIGKVASNTANTRRELGGPPVNFFWHRVGMPSTPEFKSVGKRATSIITPVRASLVSDNLRDAYIGDELATIIGDAVLMEEVLAWRDAWKENRNDTSFDGNDSNDEFSSIPF